MSAVTPFLVAVQFGVGLVVVVVANAPRRRAYRRLRRGRAGAADGPMARAQAPGDGREVEHGKGVERSEPQTQTTIAVERRPGLSPAEIRELPNDKALLMHRRDEPRLIATPIASATRTFRSAMREWVAPDLPVARIAPMPQREHGERDEDAV